jgi:uncharacterized membrane protein YcaP (DUF421 family)
MTIAFIRTLILYFILIIVIRLMGKRQIGELEPIELVVMIMISDLATVPMQNTGTPLLGGVIPILTLLSLEIILSSLMIKCSFFSGVIAGKPSIIIENGIINQREMKRMRLTIEELIEELRQKGYLELSQIKYAILETNGKLSVIPFPLFEKVNRQDLQIVKQDNNLQSTIISDGKIRKRELKRSGKDISWIMSELKKQNIANISRVFLMQIDTTDKVLIIPKEIK